MSTCRGSQPTPLHYSTEAEFLGLRRLPGRSNSWQAAAIIGCEVQHLPVLNTARLLKPLGNPPPNAPKYYCTRRVLELAQDERWLERVSDALVAHWARRNTQKKKSGRKSTTNNAKN